jgi:hypothetical protein
MRKVKTMGPTACVEATSTISEGWVIGLPCAVIFSIIQQVGNGIGIARDSRKRFSWATPPPYSNRRHGKMSLYPAT